MQVCIAMFKTTRYTFALPKAALLHPLPGVTEGNMHEVYDPATNTKGLISVPHCSTSPKFVPKLIGGFGDGMASELTSAMLKHLDCDTAMQLSVRVRFRASRHPLRLHPSLFLNATFGREQMEVVDADVQHRFREISQYIMYVYVPAADTVTMDVIMRMLGMLHKWPVQYGHGVLRGQNRLKVSVAFNAVLDDPQEPKVWDFASGSVRLPAAETHRFAYDTPERISELPFYTTVKQLVEIASRLHAEWLDVEVPCACNKPIVSTRETDHMCWSMQDSRSHAAMLEAARAGDPEVEAELAREW